VPLANLLAFGQKEMLIKSTNACSTSFWSKSYSILCYALLIYHEL